MSLPHALLTALIEHPCSGSELTSRFEKSIGFLWQASHQQIYRELSRLEASGFVRGTAVDGARGRKRTYEVLNAGREELRRWAGSELPHEPLRTELMVRLRAEASIGPSDLVHQLQTVLDNAKASLATYQNIRERGYRDPKTKEDRLNAIILQAGIDYEEIRVRSCEKAIALLREEAGV